MDPNLVVPILVTLWGASGLVALLRQRARYADGWKIVYALNTVAPVVTWALVPSVVALIVGPLFVLSVVVPTAASNLAQRFAVAGRFTLGRICATVARLTHPDDGWGGLPAWVGMQEALVDGDLEGAERRAAQVRAAGPSVFADHARIVMMVLDDSYADFVAWVNEADDPAEFLGRLPILNGYLTALGQLDRFDELFATYERHAAPRARRGPPVITASIHVTLAVRFGEVAWAGRLLDGPLAGLNPVQRQQHMARTLQAAGREEEARERLEAIVADPESGAYWCALAERALESPLEPVDRAQLDAGARALLDRLAADSEHDERFGIATASARRAPIATRLLALVLAIVFTIQVLRDASTNVQNLVEMGALVLPTSLTPGEWWRPYTAAFLHFGWLHALLNLLGLLVLGGLLERAWGPVRLLIGYAFAVFVSSQAVLHLGTEQSHAVFAGASGGIMGLLGVLGARLALGSLLGRSALVRRQLVLVLAMLGLQMVFDLSVPNVSSTAHLAGLAAGLAFGAVLTTRDVVARRLGGADGEQAPPDAEA